MTAFTATILIWMIGMLMAMLMSAFSNTLTSIIIKLLPKKKARYPRAYITKQTKKQGV